MSETKHKCFISFKTQDIEYKKYIQNHLSVEMIDKSLNEPINSDDEDYIMQKDTIQYLIGNRLKKLTDYDKVLRYTCGL